MNNALDGAECASSPDPDLWFREGDELRAKVVCDAICPVRDACLSIALADPELSAYGIWGGTTPGQRMRLRRRVKAIRGAA